MSRPPTVISAFPSPRKATRQARVDDDGEEFVCCTVNVEVTDKHLSLNFRSREGTVFELLFEEDDYIFATVARPSDDEDDERVAMVAPELGGEMLHFSLRAACPGCGWLPRLRRKLAAWISGA